MKDPEQMKLVLSELRISATVVDVAKVPEGWTPGTRGTKVRLAFGKRRLTVPFFQGPAHREDPSAADVLSCLVSDASSGEESFEDFCSSFGYDEDSRKAEATWKACKRIAPKLKQFLGDAFERVSQAEH